MGVRKTATVPAATKCATGISGLDELSHGGIPRRRTSLLMGGPGSGKTVFALQHLVNAVKQRKETGIFVAFEESPRQLLANATSFDWNLPALARDRLIKALQQDLERQRQELIIHAAEHRARLASMRDHAKDLHQIRSAKPASPITQTKSLAKSITKPMAKSRNGSGNGSAQRKSRLEAGDAK